MKRWTFITVVAALLCYVPLVETGLGQISVGPGGISIGGGSVYIPFNNGSNYNNGYSNGYNRTYSNGYNSGYGRGYGPGGNYGPGGYYGPGYDGGGLYGPNGYYARTYGRSGVYWSPGMYWLPGEYWYGDRNWSRYNNGYWSNNQSTHPTGNEPEGWGAELPPVPRLEELQRMNWTHLRRVLSYGANRLEQGLAQAKTGEKWAKYLQTNQLQAIVANDDDIPPTRTEAAELLAMLERYNGTTDNASYASISNLWGFQTVQAGLSEFIQNPATRYRHQLTKNSEELDQALERFATGAGWQKHLALPANLFVEDQAGEGEAPPDPEALRKVLQRFDDVAANSAYKSIASLPAFQATRDSLARYLGRPPQPVEQEQKIVETPEPPSAEPNDAQPEKGVPTDETPGAQPPKQAVEELLPPPNADPFPAGPAVREKE